MSRLDLANATGFAKGNVSKVVDRLCDLGQLDIVPRPEQIRNYRPLVQINDAGRAARKLPTPVYMPPRRGKAKVKKPAKAAAPKAVPKRAPAPARVVAAPTPAPRPPVPVAPEVIDESRPVGKPDPKTLGGYRGVHHPCIASPIRPPGMAMKEWLSRIEPPKAPIFSRSA